MSRPAATGQRGWRLGAKRALDVALAGGALVVLSPVLAVVALLVAATLGRPVLFRQLRPGRHRVAFELWKFRTMTEARGPDGELRPDAERLTPLGRRLRGLALDELPQLFNVIRGEMSLVGPRPLHVEYLDHYTSEQDRRHEVLPGMTGWAQVAGRNLLGWDDRLALDVWYADHWSLGLDLRILARTPAVVASRLGVAAPGHATMPRFDDPGPRFDDPGPPTA